MASISVKHIPLFQQFIYKYYNNYGRHDLPWRHTQDPYHILVSEIMLQQTQVDRVIPKYQNFLKAFPTTKTLANANFSHVLALWMGLGYNRRAQSLQRSAQAIEETYNGKFPKASSELLKLPGIGPYTSSAILAFAYNQPTPLIETNLRTIYLYHFFPQSQTVSDEQLLQLITQTLNHENPRDWYYALMDYGSFLKKQVKDINKRSKHYLKQSQFAGSDRQLRGQVLRLLLKNPNTKSQLITHTSQPKSRISKILKALQKDQLITHTNNLYTIPTK